mmetsp:Transcript_13361/g.41570  ORF Transcript_13361/g.41570 Transcript_13361/m.41570 type:complete len:259 (+) Transcript_13361:639-1415(+)
MDGHVGPACRPQHRRRLRGPRESPRPPRDRVDGAVRRAAQRAPDAPSPHLFHSSEELRREHHRGAHPALPAAHAAAGGVRAPEHHLRRRGQLRVQHALPALRVQARPRAGQHRVRDHRRRAAVQLAADELLRGVLGGQSARIRHRLQQRPCAAALEVVAAQRARRRARLHAPTAHVVQHRRQDPRGRAAHRELQGPRAVVVPPRRPAHGTGSPPARRARGRGARALRAQALPQLPRADATLRPLGGRAAGARGADGRS